jgi:predicted AlkP superfamily pyrophosphatase or phosphodiesterase
MKQRIGRPYVILMLMVGVFGSTTLALHLSAADTEPPRPRLAVLVFFDQLRGDYLTRWHDLFGDGGFHRLEQEGAWFQNCHYDYANTFTGSGHASVAAGCRPETHGIIGNDWYDRAGKKYVNCVEAERYEQVPPAADPDSKLPKPLGISPERLLCPTLGDALKESTQNKGRVVALSLKDCAAVLPGGRKPDACYWYDPLTGAFVTSTYYRDQLHPWVADFNKRQPAERWFGKEWTRLRPDLDYVKHSGPDDVEGEGTGVFQGRTFPHPFDGGPGQSKRTYYAALYNSPFGNELLLELAKQAIAAEKLGSGPAPDLLCLSFSGNDPVGHTWGPDSQEVLDVTLRADVIVKELLAYLDAKVGKGRYVLALTADHGVCPLPEVSRKQGKEAGRLSAFVVAGKAEAFLQEKFGAKDDLEARWLEAIYYPWLYLNAAQMQKRKLKQAEVEEALARWLEKQTGIQAAHTRSELLAGVRKDDPVGQAVRRSFQGERCGDVGLVLKPYYLLYSRLSGTTHGTPHPYDTHVPLLVFGPAVSAGVRKEPVRPEAATAILAHALGIKPPAKADAPLPDKLFSDR